MTPPITREDAVRLVTARINAPDPEWPAPDRPEFIVTRTDDHRLGWVVYHDSRLHQETGDFRHAIAGNSPYLVSAADGSLHITGTAGFPERLRAAELALESHLAARSAAPSEPPPDLP